MAELRQNNTRCHYQKRMQLKKYITSRNIVFAFEIACLILASTGFWPREIVLFSTGLLLFFIIFSDLKDSLWLAIASIPLYAALPLGRLDTLASWRIVLAVLFLVLFFKQGISVSFKKISGKWKIKESLKYYWLEYFAAALLLLGLISVGVAEYPVLAVKKLLFLINIFLLFLIVRNIARDKNSILAAWRAAAVGGGIVLGIGIVQFIVVLFVPLFSFWQFWAKRVIDAFYGQNLSELLSVSNTWFAYYESNPPTLRLFSIFPDSHSFALFCIFLLPVFFGLAYFEKQKKARRWYWILIGLALGGAIFSGSRGVWLSILPVFLVAVYLHIKNLDRELLRRAFMAMLLFFFIFVFSAGYPFVYYKFQSWTSTSTLSLFERARSISDLDEQSNKSRLQIWKTSLESISKKPILGVGLGNYVSVINADTSAAKKGASAHNLYLDIFSETGFLGALLLLAMIIDIIWTSWLVFRRANEKYIKLYGLMMLLCTVWLAGYNLFDVVLLNDKVLLIFMVITAVLYNLRNLILDPGEMLSKPEPIIVKK